MQNDPRYVPVAAALPEVLPPITRYEAERASRLLAKRFGKQSLGAPNGRTTHPPRVRRCWVALMPTRGLQKGWARLIHDVSHIIFRNRHPNARPHDGGHATLERELAQTVVEYGWLDGVLKPTVETPAQRHANKLYSARCAVERWERKESRAKNALRKLRARIKRLEAKGS